MSQARSTTSSFPPTVLIDVDGTIADSLPAIIEGFKVAMRAIDHPIPGEAFLRRIPGPPMVETLASLGLPPPLRRSTRHSPHTWTTSAVAGGLA